MDDLISRQAVLEATSTTLKITGKENAETVYEYIKKLCDDIKALPSSQTADAVEVIRCKDCKWHRYDSYCENLSVIGFELDDFCSFGERRTDEAD